MVAVLKVYIVVSSVNKTRKEYKSKGSRNVFCFLFMCGNDIMSFIISGCGDWEIFLIFVAKRKDNPFDKGGIFVEVSGSDNIIFRLVNQWEEYSQSIMEESVVA